MAGVISAGCTHAAWRRSLGLRGGLRQLCGYLQPPQRYVDLGLPQPEPGLQLHAVNALALCAVDSAAREALIEAPPAPPPPAEDTPAAPPPAKGGKGGKGEAAPPPKPAKPKPVCAELSGMAATDPNPNPKP